MKDKDKPFFMDNEIPDGINIINRNPEFQLQIIKHFFPQVNSGKKFKIHEEKTPSSVLKLDNNKYWVKNFGTGQKALDWLNIAENQLGFETSDALRYVVDNIIGTPLAPKKSLVTKRRFNTLEKRIYAIENNKNGEAKQYLESRKIDTKKLPANCFFQSNNIDGTPDSIAFFDSEKRLINERKLNTEKGQYKNTGQLYNSLFDRLYKPEEDWVFLVEGCINSLSIPEYSSLALFSADNNFSDFRKLQSYLKGKTIVLAFDGDKAGDHISDRLYSLITDHELTNKPVHRLLLPEKKDLNDLLREKNLNTFLEDPQSYKQLHPLLLENSKDETSDFQSKGFFKRNHCYWVQSTVKGKTIERRISNFLMDVLYFFPDGTDNAVRIFYLQNNKGKTDMVAIPAQSLKLPNFKAAIRSKSNHSFLGSVEELDRILEDIFSNEREATEISIMGYQPEEFVFAYSNGLLHNKDFLKVNRFGVVELPQGNFYLPAFATTNKKSKAYLQEKKIYFRKGNLSFSEWSALFIQAYNNMGMVGTMFIIAALFRDIIFEELEFFPYLFLFGDAGVGKTSYAKILLSLFYVKKYEGISLEGQSSAKAIARTVHKFCNGLVYLKEYVNNLNSNIIGMLKTGYEGVGYSRAQSTNDLLTHDTFFNSAVILDGNSLPSETSALLSRMIVLDFKNNIFTQSQDQAFTILRDEAENGFGRVTKEIFSNRKHFTSQFKTNLKLTEKQLKTDDKYTQLTTRSLKHLTLFLAVYKSIYPVLKIPFTYEELLDCLGNLIASQDNEIAGLSRVSKFWNMLDFLKSEGQIKKGIHYTFATRSGGLEFIALKLDLLHSLYLKNVTSHDGEITRKNDLLRLIQNDPAFIPSWMKGRNHSVTIKGFGSAYAFDPLKINLNLNSWEK